MATCKDVEEKDEKEEEAMEVVPPPGSHRLKDYKTKGINVERIRTKREEEGIQLRKEKRLEQVIKRRELVRDRNMVGSNGPSPENERNDGESLPPSNENKNEINKNTKVEKKNEAAVSVDTPLDRLALLVREGNQEMKEEAVKIIRQLLTRKNPPLQEVIETGVVEDIVECVKADEPESLQVDAAWALTNIASGTSEQTRCVVEAGAVPRLVQLLDSHDTSVREQVMWALGNITGDCRQYRDMVIDYGILAIMKEVIGNSVETVSMRRQASWTLSNLCRHKESRLSPDVVGELLPLFNIGLNPDNEPDTDCIIDLCWGVSFMTDCCSDDVMLLFLNSNVLTRIIDIIKAHHDSKRILHPSVRVIGNVASGNDDHTQRVIDLEALPVLKDLLTHDQKQIRKEVCWAISNVAAGNREQIKALIDAGIVPLLLDILVEGDYSVKKEAVWAISNMCMSGSPEQIRYVVERGGLQRLCQSLSHDNDIIVVALEGIAQLMKHGNGEDCESNPYIPLLQEFNDQIEELTNHPNEDIYRLAERIFSTYLNKDESEEEQEKEEEEDARQINLNRNFN